jgi:hypothetical protein
MNLAMLFVGFVLLWLVWSGKALLVWKAITAPPPAAQHPQPPAAR